MSTHDLKTWPEFFGAVFDGRKTFEVRRDDREFQVGDLLRLREWDPATEEYTGAQVWVRVTYVVPMTPLPISGYVGMSIERIG